MAAEEVVESTGGLPVINDQEESRHPFPVVVGGPGMERIPVISRIMVDHIVKGNDEDPHLFMQHGHAVRLTRKSRNDTALHTEALNSDRLHSEIVDKCTPVRETKEGSVPAFIPGKILSEVAGKMSENLPALKEVTSVPYLTRDGDVIWEPGYNEATEIYLNEHKVPRIPETPTPEQIAEAGDLLKDFLGDFSYANEASRANAMSMLVTAILRSTMAGDAAPLYLVNATAVRAGKSLLPGVIGTVAEAGRAPSTSPWPETDAEFRKGVGIRLMKGTSFFLYDNVKERCAMNSGVLAAILTAVHYEDRIITTKDNVDVELRVLFVATGINMAVSSELCRRSVLIDLVPGETGKKFIRSEHELREFASAEWRLIVAAVLTLTRAWFVAKQPEPECGLHDFAEWRRIVGGVLALIPGMESFLGNVQTLSDRVDSEVPEWTVFLEELHSHFEDQPFITAKLQAALLVNPGLDNVVPADLAKKLGTRREIGKLLGKYRDRDDLGKWKLIHHDTVGHGGDKKWRVVPN